MTECASRPAYVSRPGHGGLASFVGVVRSLHEGRRVKAVSYEAFEPLVSHTFPADAGDPKPPADALPQRRYQRTPERIARRFSSNKENEGRLGCGHNRPTPTTNSPVRSAARMTSSRSRTIVASASMAIPLNPVSAASVTVRKPIVGRSARRS